MTFVVQPPGPRFFHNVVKHESGCWLWTGSCSASGYGTLCVNGKATRAHRFSYMIHVGDIPEGLCVCHKCDVRNCVNPEHLFLGTEKENMQDAARKGRKCRATKWRPIGESNIKARVTDADVARIRYGEWSSLSNFEIASLLGVKPKAIYRIRARISWKHLQ